MPPPPHDNSSLGELYDRYLDAARRGDAPAMSQYVEDAPWLRALHELAGHAGDTIELRASDAPAPLAPEPDLPFARLGEFRLIRRLGEGGMGIVFLAEQESLRRLVALKVIRPELAASPTAVARFTREAQAVARLRHPHIVAVHALTESDGVRFFTMDLLPGANLDEVLRREVLDAGRLPPVRQILRWCAQIADALDCAHRAGVVHRDVKPSNIRIVDADTAMLMDFGLARDLESDAPSLTRAFAGSPSYAAPEQVSPRGGDIDARTDVYGLGATLYEALTGAPPFAADTVERVLARVLTEEATAPSRQRGDVPRDVDIVVLRALEKDPARRYPSAQALAADLRAVLELRPIQAKAAGQWTRAVRLARRHPAWLAAGAATLLALAIAGAMWAVSVARDHANAAELLRTAQVRLDDHASARVQTARAAFRLAQLERAEATRAITPGERGALTALRGERDRARRDRELTFASVQEDLAHARRIHPSAPALDDAWARLYFERWLDLRTGEDVAAAELYRRLALDHDRRGDWAARIAGSSGLTLRTDPPGAEVFLFQYASLADVRPDAEPRVVPMRAQGEADALPPGTLALRVTARAGDLRSDDLVLEVDGHPARIDDATAAAASRPALVLRDGLRMTVSIPPGATLRATAVPLPLSAARRLGRTPLVDHALTPAWFVLAVRLPGHEDLRIPFHVDHTAEHWFQCAKLDVELWRNGTTPAGFVRIAADAFGAEEAPCLMAEREVTVAEWRVFLADAMTRQRLEEGGAALVPAVGAWRRDAAGVFAPTAAPDDAPVLGIDWHAAQAFVTWRNERGSPLAGHEFALPTALQWERAAKGGDGRRYVFGHAFRDEWVRDGDDGPRVLRRVVDESPWGVFDLAGGASEWCADVPPGEPGLRRLAGGNWRDRDADAFAIGTRLVPAESRDAGCGMRLVLRRMDGGR